MFQCPLCSARAGDTRADFDHYQVVECAACGVLSTSPFPTPETLRTLYDSGYYSGPAAARFRVGAAERVVRFFRWRRAKMIERRMGGDVCGRRVLDIGCGRGDTLAWLQKWGADVHGTQVSATAAQVARALVGEDRIFVGALADARYPDASFDCITLWHVLEHVPEPVALLQEIRRLLTPGGFVYIEVPNAGGWAAQRFRHHWLAYDVPKHLFHFTPRSLIELARQAGLERVGEVHSSIEYNPVTLLQTLLNAGLGGRSVLFRRLTHEPVTGGSEAGAARRWLEPLAAGLLLIPVIAVSGVLSWRHQGETFGAYFRP
jgi:2-polyprenyl-3-methyl-5-hydroxy-6-metoxy-1,4-benzoquinol methylase